MYFSLRLLCAALSLGAVHALSPWAVLKAKEVNLREGPSPDHAILWVYRCPGWPVMIQKKCDQWYFVTDALGAKGWVKGAMLAFHAGAVTIQDKVPLYQRQGEGSVLAYVQKGAVLRLLSHEEQWAFVMTLSPKIKGWMSTSALWPLSLTPKKK